MRTDAEIRERLRGDLPTIRKVAGWSAEHLASLLDVSRVTIVNIENTPGKLSTVQYLAIRALLQAEITETKNSTLKNVLTVLVDRDNVSEEMKQELRDRVESVAKTMGRKVGSAAVGREVAEQVKTLAEMKLSEIPPETILRGQAILDELLTRPINEKHEEG